jgi:hypothetical protein
MPLFLALLIVASLAFRVSPLKLISVVGKTIFPETLGTKTLAISTLLVVFGSSSTFCFGSVGC